MKRKSKKQNRNYKLKPRIVLLLGVISMFNGLLYTPGETEAKVFNVFSVAEFQNALTTAESNTEADTINVTAGSYTVSSTLNYSGSEDLIINGSSTGLSILDGGNANQIMNISNDSNLVTVKNITFQNGRAEYISSFGDGGGLRVIGSDITIENCEFIDNYSDGVGGGLNLDSSTALLLNNVFSNNLADNNAGAVFAFVDQITVTNNTFYKNASNDVDNIDIRQRSDSATADVYNNIIWLGVVRVYTDPDLNGNGGTVNFFNNDAGQLQIIGDDSNVFQGNTITIDPKFVDRNPNNPPETWDLHLQGGSPCVDAAYGTVAPATDKDGKYRFDDPATTNTGTGTPNYVDIGAFEFGGISAPLNPATIILLLQN